jgi:hypothetical protein
MDSALAGDAAQALEGWRNNPHAEMRFALRARACMTPMLRTLVFDGDLKWGEGGNQLLADIMGNGHDFPSPFGNECQARRFLVFSRLPPIIRS